MTAAVVEAEVENIAAVQTLWRWVVVPLGDDAFLVPFPSMKI